MFIAEMMMRFYLRRDYDKIKSLYNKFLITIVMS